MTVCSMKSLLANSFPGEWGSETGDVLTPVLRTTNFNEDGSLDYGSPAFRCIPEKKVLAKRMQRGDIILEKSGGTPNRPVGIMAYYDSDDAALCSNFNHVLRFDANLVNPFFMFHQLRWLREKGAFAPYTRKTTGLQNLQMKTFVNLDLKVPTIAEQNSAAVAVREIDSQRNEFQVLLERFDELVKSRFVEMFGDLLSDKSRWPTDELGNHIDILAGYPFDSSQFTDHGIKICGGLIIAPNRIVWAESKHWRSIQGFEKYLLAPGDIVVALDRPWISEGFKIAAIAESDPQSLLIQRTARIRGLDLEQAFIMRLLDSDAFKSHCSVTGSLVPHISHKSIKSFRVPVPPLALQQEFAAFVAQVDKLKLDVQLAIDKLQLLYDSLAQEYFSE